MSQNDEQQQTTNLVLNGPRNMLSRPGLWEELREDPSQIPNAVEETCGATPRSSPDAGQRPGPWR